MTRIEQLYKLITRRKLDAVLLNNPAELYYFCGFSGSDGYLICTKSQAFFFTDRRYIQRAKAEVTPEFNPVIINGNILEFLADELRKMEVSELGVVDYRFTLSDQNSLRKHIPNLKYIPIGHAISGITAVKKTDEITCMSKSLHVTETALEQTISHLKDNQTEAGFARELQINALRLGAESVSFEPIVASNVNAAEPHYAPGNQRIGVGNGFLLIDCGFTVGGFTSDITRMVHLGEPSSRFIEMYEHVRTAKNRAIETMRHGSKICDAFTTANTYFEKHAIDQYFTHALGHGLGREVHENPVIRGTSEEEFSEGMVVTIEPGIYIPGWGGIRIEDTVVIEYSGARVINGLSDTYFSLQAQNGHEQINA